MISGILQATVLIAEGKKVVSEIYFWLGVIVVLAVLLGMIALWLRKRLMAPVDDQPMAGFTLKDLRKLHELGQLSDEELAAAEEKALARSRSHYLGTEPAAAPEFEDIGHLSTDSEDDHEGGTENNADISDKNPGDEPKT